MWNQRPTLNSSRTVGYMGEILSMNTLLPKMLLGKRKNESGGKVLWGEDTKFRFVCIEQEVTVDIQVAMCRRHLVG